MAGIKIDKTTRVVDTDLNSTGVDMLRMKTIGGWLVWLNDTSTGVPTDPVLVPDPKHEWDPSTTDDS